MQWYNELKKVKTAEDYIAICAKNGIEFSDEQKKNFSAAFAGKNGCRLSDEELAGVAGGYLPIFDECRDSWNESICLISRCWRLKRIKYEIVDSDKPLACRYYAYYTCLKGCFSSLKRDITNTSYV
jgi:hypothetical protein